jgi:hypothetical protein
MSAIEKIKETWTSSSITTLFRLCPKADIATPFPLQSPIAGFNWRLIMSWAPPKGFRNRPSKYHLFFSSNDCPSAWSGAPITVTLSFPMRSHHNGHVGDSHLSTTATLGGDKCLLITRSIDDFVDSLISLEVSFTNLPTQNLFDALACVGLAPEAPASANAEEPNIPQARTALRALDQSIKTGKSFDIIFHAYTRRLSTGKITRPIPIYASTTVLEGTTLLPDFCTFYSYFFFMATELRWQLKKTLIFHPSLNYLKTLPLSLRKVLNTNLIVIWMTKRPAI